MVYSQIEILTKRHQGVLLPFNPKEIYVKNLILQH